ncbi:AAA domain-containing protein [Marinactinospora rubrisoli]|uniref:AAA domain-containing protein n=1 Tax=Marinactinospora rubrisoli TaxID=2715399 RepID=A0ABW2KJT9_9ACTN
MRIGRRRALLIAATSHTDPVLADLPVARAGARTLDAVLRAHGRFDETTLLLAPDRARALAAARSFLADTRPDDLLLLYFAGYGLLTGDGRLFLAARDTAACRPRRTAIPVGLLGDLLRAAPARAAAVLLDCWHRVAGDSSAGGARPGLPEVELRRELAGAGVVVSAADRDVAAPDPAGRSIPGRPGALGHADCGVLTLAAAAALAGAAEDRDGDGWVDVRDLVDHLRADLGPITRRGRPVVLPFGDDGGAVRLVRGRGAGGPERAGSGALVGHLGPARGPSSLPEQPQDDPALPLDDARWRALLGYHAACTRRAAVIRSFADLDRAGGHVCWPAGPEPLFSGADPRPALGSAAAGLIEAARERGDTVRYGYPTVLLDPAALPAAPDGDRPGTGLLAAPLFVVDVTAESGITGPRLRALSAPAVNPAVLRALGHSGRADMLELRDWLVDGQEPDGPAIADLAGKARRLLSDLGVEPLDDIDPARLHGGLARQPPRAGARNVALLFRAVPPAGITSGILADLASDEANALQVRQVPGTALGALAEPRPAGSDPGPPVVTGRLGEAQHDALRSAMTERLTVVAGPPGTGAGTLAAAAVQTAIVAGQSVLIAAPDTATLDAAVRCAEAGTRPLVVRTGGSRHRAAEPRALAELLERGDDSGDPAARHASLREDWASLRTARWTLDAVAAQEHELALLALTRARLASAGWDPRALFDGGRRPPGEWARRIDGAFRRGAVGALRRRAIRRGLGVPTDSASLAWLCRSARAEHDWRVALDRWQRSAVPADPAANLEAASGCHRVSSRDCLAAAVAHRAADGRGAVLDRLRDLNRQGAGNRAGFPPLLTAVPAWATTASDARALPAQAALFDLLVLIDAGNCPVAEALPLLYRAERALVIGDPRRAASPTGPEPEEELRHRTAARLGERWLTERALRGIGDSAYHACAAALAATGRPVLWLDEPEGRPPRLAALADRHFYGGRSGTDRAHPGRAPAPDARTVEWRNVLGGCASTTGRSYVNPEEANAVAAVVRDLDATLPDGATVGVLAPYRSQRALLRRLIRRRGHGREVRVGSVETFRSGEHDVVVLSPTVCAGAPPDLVRRAAPRADPWHAALTRATRRVIVVGDAAFWSACGGLPAELGALGLPAGAGPGREVVAGARTRPPAGLAPARPAHDPARQALLAALRSMSDEVTEDVAVDGHHADLRVRTPHGSTLVLVDRSGSGRELRRLLDRRALLGRISGEPVVRAPAWRCLHDPDVMAKEILAAGT